MPKESVSTKKIKKLRKELKKFLTKSMYLILMSSKIDFAVGGQALIEGVMMRSPNYITMAVRKQDGTIVQKREKFHSLTQRFKPLNVPMLRGVINLFEMMLVGTKALNFSANEAIEEPEDEKVKTAKNSKKEEVDKKIYEEAKEKSRALRIFEAISLVISVGIALAFSLTLFKFIPLWTTEYLRTQFTAMQESHFLFNLVDGIIKTTLFVTYIYLIGKIPSFKRVFQYHGAEHKSIYTYEKNLDLTVKNAEKQIRFHPRCGTSFVIIVFAISVLVYSLVPRNDVFFLNFLTRVAFLPVIAGIAYEILKLSAKNIDKKLVKVMIQPGLWFQRLTTQEPDKEQLEVGLKSLEYALELEGEVIVP